MKFFDLFAGVGGFRLGMERAGHECVGSCEWDKYARETYNKNFGAYPKYDDARHMSLASQPHFDVLCAGFPCQAFSIAGKRMGFEDTRGTVFFEIARVAREIKPRYLFLENVKGLLSHDEGRTFSTIISTLDEMGYDAEWQVLNSKYFVPQNRERIFIIGHLRGERTRQIFPLGDLSKESDRKIKKAGKLTPHNGTSFYDTSGISPTLISSEGSGSIIKIIDGRQGYRVYDVNGISQTLNANAGGFGAKMGLIGIKSLGNIPIPFMKRRNEPKQSDICDYLRNNNNTSMNKLALKTLITKTQLEHYFRSDSSGALPNKDDWLKLKKALNFDNTYDEIMTDYVEDFMTHEMSTRVHDSTGLAPTLTGGEKLIGVRPQMGEWKPTNNQSSCIDANYHKGCDARGRRTMIGVGTDNMRIRKLTPKECERLQGFPDDWTKGVSDTQRYRQMGNAVTVPVVEYIAKRLK